MSATMSNGKKIFYGRLAETDDEEQQAEEEKCQTEEAERQVGEAKRQIEEANLRKNTTCENAAVEDAAIITTQNSLRRFHQTMPYAKLLFNEADCQYSIMYYFQPQGTPHAALFGDPRPVPFEIGNANSGRKVNSKTCMRREFKPLKTKGHLVGEVEEEEAWRRVGQRPRAKSAPQAREKVEIAGGANERP